MSNKVFPVGSTQNRLAKDAGLHEKNVSIREISGNAKQGTSTEETKSDALSASDTDASSHSGGDNDAEEGSTSLVMGGVITSSGGTQVRVKRTRDSKILPTDHLHNRDFAVSTKKLHRSPISDVDKMLYVQASDATPMVINTLVVSDDSIDYRDACDRLWQLSSHHPRFRCCIKDGLWIDNDDFNIENHVTQEILPRDKTIFMLLSERFETRLPVDIPAWRFHIVDDPGKKCSYVIGRINHTMCDGLALMQLLNSMWDANVVYDQVHGRRNTIDPSTFKKAALEKDGSPSEFESISKGKQQIWMSEKSKSVASLDLKDLEKQAKFESDLSNISEKSKESSTSSNSSDPEVKAKKKVRASHYNESQLVQVGASEWQKEKKGKQVAAARGRRNSTSKGRSRVRAPGRNVGLTICSMVCMAPYTLMALGWMGNDPHVPCLNPAPTPGEDPIRTSREREIAYSNPIRLDEIKRIARFTNGTVNDVLMANVASVLRQYMLSPAVGMTEDKMHDIKAIIPVAIRKRSKTIEMDNRVSTVFLTLPTSEATNLQRLKVTKQRMDALKMSPLVFIVYMLIRWIASWFSPRTSAEIQRRWTDKCTVMVSNVPGDRVQQSFCGARIKQMFGFVPLYPGKFVSISVFSYANTVIMAVNADKTKVKNPSRLAILFETCFEDLREEANEAMKKGVEL